MEDPIKDEGDTPDQQSGEQAAKPETENAVDATATNEAKVDTENQPEALAVSTAATPATITVTFTGAETGSVTVPVGTKAGDAMKAANIKGGTMMRAANNTVINANRVLKESTTITTVKQARGG